MTTPIYYVNDEPHVGHAYTTIAADYLARFYRMAGREAFFLTGTDEHGSKVAEAAAAASKTPQQLCDEVVKQFVDTWKTLGLEHDYFVRTTDQRHIDAVIKLLNNLHGAKTPDGREAIYKGVYEGLYCTGCEKFVTESDLVDGMCPDHKRVPEPLKESNYFFRLEPYLPIIKEKIESNELIIMPEERRKEVLGLLKSGLPDFSISRESVDWGIPLPFDKNQTAYVWVDALPNYISAIGYGDDPKQFDKWWNQAEIVHLMAKDILRFHTIYWPAMLMALGLKLPDKIMLHGFFTVNGEKMSKSAANTKIDPRKMAAIYGTDATRYLLLNQYPFGIDGDIKEKEFVTRYNSDLANDLGNLVSRVAKMIIQYCDGVVPEPCPDVPGQEKMMTMTEKLPDLVYRHVRSFRITDAISEALNLVRATNKFVEDAAPWKLAKEGKNDMVGGVLYTAAELIRVATILLFPIMPQKMRQIRSVFGLKDDTLTMESAQTWFDMPQGNKIEISEAVFPRLDPKTIPALVGVAANEKNKKKESVEIISFDEFKRIDLRVALVEKAEKVEKADRLLKLQLDVGGEKRQIVAGVAESYSPQDLVGKKIVIVANLKPAKIRGIESQGMLLAAGQDNRYRIIIPDGDVDSGASVG